MVRAVVHSDREALYVFQLQFSDNENRLPNMFENGEVGMHSQLLWPCTMGQLCHAAVTCLILS